MTAADLAAKLTAPFGAIGAPAGRCRACPLPVDGQLVDRPDGTGLHIGCDEPVPLPATIAAPASPFVAPAGPPPAHPLKGELISMVRWFESNSPRSLQRQIGPSEIGVDCMRRIAYKLLGTQPANDTADPWFAFVGSSVHDGLAYAIDQYQRLVLSRTGENLRYLIENRVQVTLDENGINGSCDLFDRDLFRVVDHKIVGETALRKYREQGPSTVYRKQVHIYGLGWENAGYEVREVAIAFYPRSNYLDNLHVWAEPYDRQIALDALNRLDSIRQLAAALPPNLIPAQPDPAGCAWCDFYRPGGPADATGCPGPLKPS
ncbi:hypothetical protein ACQEVZ_20180 [Dactylosporangium sp. CA-152071]|uniref:hypothetical protein n=1 Tax=Dactylosporangium sp. CA-152071 TaxID=3239933 RepID=UPI003D8B0535